MISKKDPLHSLPVSRVALSTRLNQLAVGSRPNTPASYVSSSLNPNKNTSVTPSASQAGLSMSSEELQTFKELPIVNDIRLFETTLNELATAVSSFKDEEVAPSVRKLIEINKNISSAVDQLETHQNLVRKINQLKHDNEQLDIQQKDKLRTLIAIRASLRQVSGLSLSASTTVQDLQRIDIQTLLDYSMKLAKFSHAPATVQSQMLHPNNYVWPAEDALRRGMLAMASLKPDELIRAELGSDVDPHNDEKMDVDEIEEKPTVSSAKNSVISKNIKAELTARPQGSNTIQQLTAASLDLDLFDPEDDDSDEENNSD